MILYNIHNSLLLRGNAFNNFIDYEFVFERHSYLPQKQYFKNDYTIFLLFSLAINRQLVFNMFNYKYIKTKFSNLLSCKKITRITNLNITIQYP